MPGLTVAISKAKVTTNIQRPIELPPVYAVDVKHELGLLRQVAGPSRLIEAKIAIRPNSIYQLDYDETSAVAMPLGKRKVVQSATHILSYLGPDAASLQLAGWRRHPLLEVASLDALRLREISLEVANSWRGRFNFGKIASATDKKGMRLPQMGAIHALHSHWTLSNDNATIVMPTGTGKTDTMVGAIVSSQVGRTLVVVPTDALRSQLFDKFLTLGILKSHEVIAAEAKLPIVGRLERIPKHESQLREFLESANIVVATMASVSRCDKSMQDFIASNFDALFVDEAHHVAASTWAQFVSCWKSKKVAQFTATPFRNDGQEVARHPIYTYPLSSAQRDGYFRPIRFHPVMEFDPKKADVIIAEAALKQLLLDRQKGFKHVLMARVSTVDRAGEVLDIYRARCPELNPVELHVGVKGAARAEARGQILSGHSSIVVCVDMLGEGFDLPTLKVAAFHDIRKNLTTTLQLAGRFVRSHEKVGDAAAFANIADTKVEDELELLYQQDADWNQLLPRFSGASTDDVLSFAQFLNGFTGTDADIDLGNLRPSFSTIVFQVPSGKWKPKAYLDQLAQSSDSALVKHRLQIKENLLVIVTGESELPKWTNQKQLAQNRLSLQLLHFDEKQRLLFIHDSEKATPKFLKRTAETVCPEGVALLHGPEIFRALGKINRLKLQNVGLKQTLARLIRYVQRFGGDVGTGLSEAQKANCTKVNLFGGGYEDGSRTTAGCSAKGRIWSRQADRLDLFCAWCRATGAKLLDPNIDPEECFRGALVPTPVGERPAVAPFWVEWPEEILQELESSLSVRFANTGPWTSMADIDLNVVGHAESGPLEFEVVGPDGSCKFRQTLSFLPDKDVQYTIESVSGYCRLRVGNREFSMVEYLNLHPPTITFVDGSMLEGCQYVEIHKIAPLFDRSRIVDWNWSGTDIKKESQGPDKSVDSVQWKVLNKLRDDDSYAVIYDDDGSGEIADVVTLKAVGQELQVGLYHCKFSSEVNPGSRSDDLYVVGGQVQKSIRWLENPHDLLSHLLRREPLNKDGKSATRYERGSAAELLALRSQCRHLRVVGSLFLVQPGLSKAGAKDQQLALLGVTENYLKETLQISLQVIASP